MQMKPLLYMMPYHFYVVRRGAHFEKKAALTDVDKYHCFWARLNRAKCFLKYVFRACYARRHTIVAALIITA